MGIQERQERERETRKTAILGAARVLLRERGFSGTTTKDIAKHCELSEATLFFYFKSKQEIFTSLLFEGIDFWTGRLEKIAALDLPAAEKLARIWQFYQEVYAEHPEYYYVSAHLARPRSMSGVSDSVREEIVRRSGDNFLQLVALLDDVLGAGNGRVAADLFWASCLGLMLLRDTRTNLGLDAHPTDRDLGRIFGLLAHGLLAEGTEKSDD